MNSTSYGIEVGRSEADPGLVELIAKELILLYPDLKQNLAIRYSSKYCTAIISELRKGLIRPMSKNYEQISFSKMQMRKGGVIKYQEKTKFIFDFMNISPKTRLVEVKFNGIKGVYARVTINPIYERLVMQAISESNDMIQTNAITVQTSNQFTVTIPVNMLSLMSYIERSRYNIKSHDRTKPGHFNYVKKVNQNIIIAQMLVNQIKIVDGIEIIEEVWEEKDCGRMYGLGQSLQSRAKDVRHAALGFCHKYDFKACAFSVMLSLAQSIDPTIRVESVAGYIRNRAAIREQIAKATGASIEDIKAVFMVLSFGGTPIDNWHNAIRKTMQTQEAYDALLKQQDFRWIVDDLKVITKTIIDTFPDQFDFMRGKHYSNLNADGKQLKATQKLAWIYQNIESYLIHEFVTIVRQYDNQLPLLTVHDCVYYKKPITSETKRDLMYLLQSKFKYVSFEHEIIMPIGTPEFHDNHYQSSWNRIEQEEQDHYQRIQAEEQQARGYKSEFVQRDQIRVKSLHTPEASYDYDNDPWFQDLTTQEQQEYRNIRNELTSAK